jgi:hypothetical protein
MEWFNSLPKEVQLAIVGGGFAFFTGSMQFALAWRNGSRAPAPDPLTPPPFVGALLSPSKVNELVAELDKHGIMILNNTEALKSHAETMRQAATTISTALSQNTQATEDSRERINELSRDLTELRIAIATAK